MPSSVPTTCVQASRSCGHPCPHRCPSNRRSCRHPWACVASSPYRTARRQPFHSARLHPHPARDAVVRARDLCAGVTVVRAFLPAPGLLGELSCLATGEATAVGAEMPRQPLVLRCGSSCCTGEGRCAAGLLESRPPSRRDPASPEDDAVARAGDSSARSDWSGLRLAGRVGAGGWGFQPRPMALNRRQPPPSCRASETRRGTPAAWGGCRRHLAVSVGSRGRCRPSRTAGDADPPGTRWGSWSPRAQRLLRDPG